MGIKAPNYTQLPNELFDEWLPDLGLGEIKVLMVIMRKTFGWHKTRDRISLTQLEKHTGLGRRHILKAVKTLSEKRLISKIKEGINGSQVTYYELVVDEDSNNLYQCPKDTPPSVLKTPTKETLTKETLLPPNPHSWGLPPISPEGGPPSASPPSSGKKEKEARKERALYVKTTDTQHESLKQKLGGDEAKLKRCYEKLSEWKISKSITTGANDYRSILNWVIKAIDDEVKTSESAKTKGNDLNDAQKENWRLNQEVVQELKVELPYKCQGLHFFYKHYVLKDKKDPSFDVSGLINHKDFCRLLEKHLRVHILRARFPNG